MSVEMSESAVVTRVPEERGEGNILEGKYGVEMKDVEFKKENGEEKEGEGELKDVEFKKEDGEEKEGEEERKDVELKKENGEEKEDGEEKEGRMEMEDAELKKEDGEEKEEGEENGVSIEENGGGKEEKREDVDMVEAENVEDEEKADEGGNEEEGEKPSEDNDVNEENGSKDGEKNPDECKEVEVLKKKESSASKDKESPRTPAPYSAERPVRKRKTVERLVEIIEKNQSNDFLIEKGRGTPLKAIPNVAHKLARKKGADLKVLHETLFGRRGKSVNFKSNILQFSGFAWDENDEKQRAKVKEKLDKCFKHILLNMCDLLDIPVLRASTRKEDLVVKLLDFMVAPHATTDVILADKDQQSSKSGKRKRVSKGSASESMEDTSVKGSRKKRVGDEGTSNTKSKRAEETEADDEDNENNLSAEDGSNKHSDDDDDNDESEEVDDADDELKIANRDLKRSSKQRSSARKEKNLGTIAKSPSKTSSSKQQLEESDAVEEKVFSRKKKNVDAPKPKPSTTPDKKEKAAGKEMFTLKGKTEEGKQSGPSNEELRKTICQILKEVDFNTSTFSDILERLDAHYKMKLAPRKSSIKFMIKEELAKLADEAEEDEDGGEEGA